MFLGMTDEPPESIEKIKTFLNKHNVTWPNVYGATETFKQFDVKVYPTTWVIGADGRIAWSSGDREPIEEAIKKALSAALAAKK